MHVEFVRHLEPDYASTGLIGDFVEQDTGLAADAELLTGPHDFIGNVFTSDLPRAVATKDRFEVSALIGNANPSLRSGLRSCITVRSSLFRERQWGADKRAYPIDQDPFPRDEQGHIDGRRLHETDWQLIRRAFAGYWKIRSFGDAVPSRCITHGGLMQAFVTGLAISANTVCYSEDREVDFEYPRHPPIRVLQYLENTIQLPNLFSFKGIFPYGGSLFVDERYGLHGSTFTLDTNPEYGMREFICDIRSRVSGHV